MKNKQLLITFTAEEISEFEKYYIKHLSKTNVVITRQALIKQLILNKIAESN